MTLATGHHISGLVIFIATSILLLEVVEEVINLSQTAIVTSLTIGTYLVHRHAMLLSLVLDVIEAATHAHARNIANTLIVARVVVIILAQ